MQESSGRTGYILVADEDSDIRRMVTAYFDDHGIRASAAATRQEMYRHLREANPSALILDPRLGEASGLDIVREVRSRSDLPVIIAADDRGDALDRVIGLELGADDYVHKPLSPRELLARVRAVLRRQEIGRATPARDPERGGYIFQGWRLERRARRLSDPEGEPVPLTRTEFNLLLAFLAAPQRPLSREHLLQATRAHEDIFDRSIDVQVLRLRRKLEKHPTAPAVIATERGVGYVFSAAVEPF